MLRRDPDLPRKEKEIVSPYRRGWKRLADQTFFSYGYIFACPEEYSQAISVLQRPWLATQLESLFPTVLGRVILEYVEWFHVEPLKEIEGEVEKKGDDVAEIKEVEKLKPLTIYLKIDLTNSDDARLRVNFLRKKGHLMQASTLAKNLSPHLPTTLTEIIKSKDKFLAPILAALEMYDLDFGYERGDLLPFFDFGNILDYIEISRQEYKTIFQDQDRFSESPNDILYQINFIAQNCIEFYQPYLRYFLTEAEGKAVRGKAPLFLHDTREIILKTIKEIPLSPADQFLRTYLGLTFTFHLTKNCNIIWPTHSNQESSKRIDFPFKQAILSGIIEIITSCANAKNRPLPSLPPFLQEIYSLLFSEVIFNTNRIHFSLGSDDNEEDASLSHYFFKYLEYISNLHIFENRIQEKAFNQMLEIAHDFIGDGILLNIEHSTLAVKTLTFSIKLQLTLTAENRAQLQKEYEELHKEITSYPKLLKLAAAFEILFGAIIQVFFSLFILCDLNNRSYYNLLLSQGIFKWRKANLSLALDTLQTSVFSSLKI
ncbi:MAG: hypothetical protein K0S27_38 [Gammaproteobacteria bacterium]|jgi:hypothetical protein|nr:hypothetical protein [Gammaproteobacteria bacterium]